MCLVPIQRLAVRGSDPIDSPFEPGQCRQDVVEACWLGAIQVAPGTITVNHRFSFRRRQQVFGLDHHRGVHFRYVQSFQDRSGGSGLFFQKAGEEP
jgi:hypothetical protein